MQIEYVDLTINAADGWWATWPVSGIGDADPLQATVDDGATWASMTRAAGTAALFFYGPDYSGSAPTESLALALGTHRVGIRRSDTPEQVVRDGGAIACV